MKSKATCDCRMMMVKALTTLSVKRHILSSYYMSFLARAVFSYLLIGKSFVLPFRCTTSSRNVKGLLIFRHLAGNGSSENLNSSKNSLGGKAIEFELHQSIDSIPGEEWNSFLGRNSSPFLEHSWLLCLEKSRCASPETGWGPQHVSVKLNGKVVAYVPLYLKGHSMGEFIFDNLWADAAYRSGIKYYPKLLVGVPFTPVAGNRILINPRIRENSTPQTINELRRLIGDFLRQIAVSNNLSSVNFNFMKDEEATSLSTELKHPKVTVKNEGSKEKLNENSNKYLRRTSIQYHWLNQNPKNKNEPFQSFDEYLECFKSKRRIAIRRERRRVLHDEQIRIDAIVGTDILKHHGLIERMFAIYKATVDKMYYGRQYLTLEFFKMLSKSDFCNNLCFICARNASTCSTTFKAEDVFAGTFNIVKDGVFYGRYWGVLPGQEINSLHFEVCYWSAIEYCIKNGLKRMEPGAGGGEYKWARGFDPALIHSVHYITHPALRAAIHQFLELETESLVDSTEYLLEKSVTGSKNLSKCQNWTGVGKESL